MLFGAHMSTGGGIWRALERGKGINCDVVQMFVKNNMQWKGKPYAPGDVEKFAETRKASGFAHVFGHTGYLINLASAPGTNRDNSMQSLLQEIELATSIDLPFLVLHPGAHMEQGIETGVKNVIAALNETFRATKHSKVRIALENTAGQGSCLGCDNSHLADIYNGVDQPERLALCLDTAHFFAAGCDIRTPQGWDNAIDQIDKTIGIEQIVAFHLNDSKTDLGSHVDRHAGIGQGKIGKEPFRHIVNDPRFANHPGCLETPKSDDLHEDVENLAILRSLMESATAKVKKGRKARAK